MDLDEILYRSGRVIVAHVVGVDINAGDGRVPRTRVLLRVEQALSGGGSEARAEAMTGRAMGSETGSSGDLPGMLTVWLPEGLEADGMTWSGYDGIPSFAPGESYLLFLRREPWRVSPVVQWSSAFLRRAVVSGRAVWVDAQGVCVTEVGAAGFALGPRVVEPPVVPGRGMAWSGVGVEASAVGRCLPAGAVVEAVEARMRGMGWQPGAWHVEPSDWSLDAAVAEPSR